ENGSGSEQLRRQPERALVIEAFVPDLDQQAQLALTEQGLDSTHGRGRAGDREGVADLERPLTREVAGGEDLVAISELVAVLEGLHPARDASAPEEIGRVG